MGARDHDRDDEISRLRMPPHSVEAEQSVLGGLLLDIRVFDAAAGLLEAGDFYRHEHRLIWDAIAEQALRGRGADVVTVFETLERIGKAEDAGGLVYLNQLAQSVPSASNVRRYAEIVRERSALRRIIAATDEAATAAFTKADPREVIDALATKIAQLERAHVRQEPKLLADVIVRQLDRLNDIAEGNVEPAWPTGIPTLDGYLNGGMRPGRVYVLAARPKVGKSSFAQHLGLHFARRGLPVLMLSQEMPEGEVADRALSSAGEVNYSGLQRGKLSDSDWSAVSAAANDLRCVPFWIDDQAALKLGDICAKARMVKGLKVLVVDYLQLSSGSGKGDNRNAEIEEISRGLKALAKDLGIAVLLLSQLNRKVEDRPDRKPILSDLRDSGAIEQDADVVIFLWPGRDLEYGQRLIGCEVAAQRNGPSGELVLAFTGRIQRWGESTEPLKGPNYSRVQKQPEEAFE
jgi:replicative DNA helicase